MARHNVSFRRPRMSWLQTGSRAMRCGLLVVLAIGFWAVTSQVRAAELAEELKNVPYQILFESHRDGNWELYQVNADGSQLADLTRTPDIQEMYPHVSPDGGRICLVVDEGEGDARRRNIYIMNRNGTDREQIVGNGRDPCWTPDGSGIIYLPAEFDAYVLRDIASKGLGVYDLSSSRIEPHPNPDLLHLFIVCPTPDGKWYLATVHAGMGFQHAIVAIETHGQKVCNLRIPGCRPDLSSDGKRVAWGADDYTIRVGDLDFSGPEPKVINQRDVVTSEKPIAVYHADWSPDGRYLAFSRGPRVKRLGPAPEMVGAMAEGWDICVADAQATNRVLSLTHDGKSNKEPDWAPRAKAHP